MPPLPGVTPPTIFVPNVIASSAWNVACWPVKPWMMTCESLSTNTLMPRTSVDRGDRPSRPRRRGPRPGSPRARCRSGSRGPPRRWCRPGARSPARRSRRSFVACTTPCAIQSHRLIPAKMFTRIARTFGSVSTIRNAFAIFSGLAPPPTSRKFAGRPPWCAIASIVPIARPAPFTMQPDVAVERDVVEAVARGVDLLRVLLVEVAELGDGRLPVQRVVVELHLAVERDQVAVLGHDERVDLEQQAVLVAEQPVDPLQQPRERRGAVRRGRSPSRPCGTGSPAGRRPGRRTRCGSRRGARRRPPRSRRRLPRRRSRRSSARRGRRSCSR